MLNFITFSWQMIGSNEVFLSEAVFNKQSAFLVKILKLKCTVIRPRWREENLDMCPSIMLNVIFQKMTTS